MAAEQVAALIDEAERLLAERYNVAALDGDLLSAVVALRASADLQDLTNLDALVEARELYRWREPVVAVLASLRAELAPPAKRTKAVSKTEETVTEAEPPPTETHERTEV